MLLDYQDGLMSIRSGPAPALANLSARQAKEKGLLTSGIYGQLGSTSYESVTLQRSLENKLKPQFVADGLILYRLIWKRKTTPLHRVYLQQRALARRMNDLAFTSWPTPNSGPQNDNDSSWKVRRTILKALKKNGNGFGLTLAMAASLASWTTPQVHDNHPRGAGNRQNPKGGNSDLAWDVKLASWAKPTQREYRDTGQNTNYKKLADKVHLSGQVHLTRPIRLTTSGKMLIGSSAQMDTGDVLNPAHSRWLMGYPPEWDVSAVMVIALSRTSQPHSSKRF